MTVVAAVAENRMLRTYSYLSMMLTVTMVAAVAENRMLRTYSYLSMMLTVTMVAAVAEDRMLRTLLLVHNTDCDNGVCSGGGQNVEDLVTCP